MSYVFTVCTILKRIIIVSISAESYYNTLNTVTELLYLRGQLRHIIITHWASFSYTASGVAIDYLHKYFVNVTAVHRTSIYYKTSSTWVPQWPVARRMSSNSPISQRCTSAVRLGWCRWSVTTAWLADDTERKANVFEMELKAFRST